MKPHNIIPGNITRHTVCFLLYAFPGGCFSRTQQTYMAHAIYLEESELDKFLDRGVGVAHCPTSNLR